MPLQTNWKVNCVKNKLFVVTSTLLLILFTGCSEERIYGCFQKTTIDDYGYRLRFNLSPIPRASTVAIEISPRGQWNYVELFRERDRTSGFGPPNCDSIAGPIRPGRIFGIKEKEVISFDDFKTWKIRPRTSWK